MSASSAAKLRPRRSSARSEDFVAEQDLVSEEEQVDSGNEEGFDERRFVDFRYFSRATFRPRKSHTFFAPVPALLAGAVMRAEKRDL